jgi:predicted metal-dependent enzyme (double-stranded beta helix superfamily)
MTVTTVIPTFINEVKAILRAEGASERGLELLAEQMRWLIANGDEVAAQGHPRGNIHTRGQAPPLYTDETGLTLAQASFDPDHITPIHSHGSWGIVGVYRGVDLYQEWRRLDDGHGAGPALIELVDERILTPGDVAIVPPPPQDIHAQKGHGGETCYEFVLFGRNVMQLPRLYFDPVRGLAEEITLHG